MPSSYTSSLRLTLPATGELTGTWGTTVNDGITTLLDNAVAGAATITMTAADYTLTTSNGATDEARAKILILTGTPGAARNVICPAVSKTYIVYNNTTGGFAQTLKTSAGTGISVPNGKTKIVRCDGTNVVEGFDAAGSVDLTGNLSYTGTLTGGTGIVNLGSGQFYKDASGNVGVGTTSPDAASLIGRNLTIYQSTSTGNVSDNAAIVVQSVNRNATISLRGSSTSANSYSFADQTASYAGIVGDTANQALFFRSGGTTERMRLDSSGNLGIGTSLPSNKLVVSNAGAAGFEFDPTNGIMQTYNRSGTAYTGTKVYALNFEIRTGAAPAANTFFLDSSGNLGIGTSSPVSRLSVKDTLAVTAASGTQYLLLGNQDSGGASGPVVMSAANRNLTFGLGNSWASASGGTVTASMTLDSSGNLGIGTSSPGQKLDVRGAGLFLLSGAGSTTPLVLRNDTGGGTTQLVKLGFDSNGAIKASINAAVWNNDYMTFNVGSDTERMRLDSLGNLGIGTVPAAWLTGGNLQLPGNIAFNGAFSIGANAYFGSGSAFRYISSNPASLYQQASGQHIWQSAASGTATNTISFQQTMVLDANGLLSLTGTASQANWRKYSTDTAPYYHAFIKARGTSAAQTTVVLGDAIGSTQFYAYNGTNEQAAAAIVGRVASTGTVSATSMPGQIDLYTTPDGSNLPLLRATLDSSGNLGIGTTIPNWAAVSTMLSVNGASTSALGTKVADTGALYISSGSTYSAITETRAQPLTFGTNNTERMRIDSSGNVGIGTTALSTKLNVYGGASGVDTRVTIGNAATALQLGVDTSNNAVIATNTANVMAFYTNNNERMRLDSSGNLGLGVTPSNAYTPGKVLQIVSGGVTLYGSSTTTSLSNNTNIDVSGNSLYQLTQAASRYQQDGGSHQWYTAPSGTAGNAISFTQAMTLDASGNLGIGTTSPASRLSVAGANVAVRADATSGYGGFYANGATGDAAYYFFAINGTETARISCNATNDLVFSNTSSATERARITSGGDLLVGTPTTGGKLTVAVVDAAQAVNLQGATGRVRFRPYVDATNGAILDATNTAENAYSPLTLQGTTLRLFGNGGTGLSITSTGNQVTYQPAESAQNASVTLSVANLQAGIITSNAAVTLTLPTGTTLEGYTTNMAVDTAFEVTFIATTANAITIGANGNTTVGNLTVSGNTSGTFRFRKTAANTFTVYRVS